ncbi:DUF4328 domain-containing protein [Streptomyces sp. NPDC094149]|uniref:DUF4328 domain-containing protein n=1 Tax=Streptomyces sp. NPDC094149 TaxID=3155079 RepID=UPI003333DDCF
MTEPVRPDSRAPLLLARLTQGAIPVAAAAEVFRAATVRAHRLHPASTSAHRSAFASMLLVYAATVAAVLFLVWFGRCRNNARLISPDAALGSDVWAVAAWLVPVANLWFPRGLLLGTLRASGPTADTRRDALLVNAWWAAWAGHAVLAVVAQSGTALPHLVLSEALFVAAAGLAVALIQRVTIRQGTALAALRPAARGVATV